MKSLHLSASLSRKAGGIFEIELAMLSHLSSLGCDISAFGLHDEHWIRDASRWKGISATVLRTFGPSLFGYAPRMLREITAVQADIAHLHYMWMYPSVAIAQWSSQTGRPYLVTPNGMLEPWALRNSLWKKRLAGWLYENRMLHRAACIHANTDKELRDIRAYGLRNPVCVLPNGVDLADVGSFQARVPDGNQKVLLFLGRLHPKKGLINALSAWASVCDRRPARMRNSDWIFVIAGWDQAGHAAALKRLCNELNLGWMDLSAQDFLRGQEGLSSFGSGDSRQTNVCDLRSPRTFELIGAQIDRDGVSQSTVKRKTTTRDPTVIFLGPTFDGEKDRLLRRANAFILPSFSEGLPMSVLEAWSYRLPVIMTDHCNLPEGFNAGSAIRVGTDMASISEGIRKILESSIPDLETIGQNGRILVEERFTWPQVAAQMKQVYEWVLGLGGRPECIRSF